MGRPRGWLLQLIGVLGFRAHRSEVEVLCARAEWQVKYVVEIQLFD